MFICACHAVMDPAESENTIAVWDAHAELTQNADSPSPMRHIINNPRPILPKLASPCTATNAPRPMERDKTNGRLIAAPTAIIPKIDPRPKTRMYPIPCATVPAAETTMSIKAADPANPWAMPIARGRRAS